MNHFVYFMREPCILPVLLLHFSDNMISPEFDGKAAMQASKESQKKAKKKGILLILGRNQPVNRYFWRFTGAKEK